MRWYTSTHTCRQPWKRFPSAAILTQCYRNRTLCKARLFSEKTLSSVFLYPWPNVTIYETDTLGAMWWPATETALGLRNETGEGQSSPFVHGPTGLESWETGRKGNLLSGRTARDGTYREEGLFPISLRKAENPGTVRNEVDASHSVKE